MSLALRSITFKSAPRIPGIRPGDVSELVCDNPTEAMKGWHAIVRGSVVLLVSPPGWRPGSYTRESQGVGPRRIHEIPRNNCFLYFEGDLDDTKFVMDISKTFTSTPFGDSPVVTQAKETKSEEHR